MTDDFNKELISMFNHPIRKYSKEDDNESLSKIILSLFYFNQKNIYSDKLTYSIVLDIYITYYIAHYVMGSRGTGKSEADCLWDCYYCFEMDLIKGRYIEDIVEYEYTFESFFKNMIIPYTVAKMLAVLKYPPDIFKLNENIIFICNLTDRLISFVYCKENKSVDKLKNIEKAAYLIYHYFNGLCKSCTDEEYIVIKDSLKERLKKIYIMDYINMMNEDSLTQDIFDNRQEIYNKDFTHRFLNMYQVVHIDDLLHGKSKLYNFLFINNEELQEFYTTMFEEADKRLHSEHDLSKYIKDETLIVTKREDEVMTMHKEVVTMLLKENDLDKIAKLIALMYHLMKINTRSEPLTKKMFDYIYVEYFYIYQKQSVEFTLLEHRVQIRKYQTHFLENIIDVSYEQYLREKDDDFKQFFKVTSDTTS